MQILIHLFRAGTQEEYLNVQSHLCATHFLWLTALPIFINMKLLINITVKIGFQRRESGDSSNTQQGHEWSLTEFCYYPLVYCPCVLRVNPPRV